MNEDGSKIDGTDYAILEILRNNGRIQWREIGTEVHLTGQAVGERVKSLKKLGIIEGYYTKINLDQISKGRTDYITVIMKSNHHDTFIEFVKKSKGIIEAHRISGNGCYVLKAFTSNEGELNDLLSEILKYANYQLNSSIKTIK